MFAVPANIKHGKPFQSTLHGGTDTAKAWEAVSFCLCYVKGKNQSIHTCRLPKPVFTYLSTGVWILHKLLKYQKLNITFQRTWNILVFPCVAVRQNKWHYMSTRTNKGILKGSACEIPNICHICKYMCMSCARVWAWLAIFQSQRVHASLQRSVLDVGHVIMTDVAEALSPAFPDHISIKSPNWRPDWGETRLH